MKTLLTALLLIAGQAVAVPVLNQNMAAEGTNIVIWPDHEDANHFYYAPSHVRLASEGSEVKFHLTEYRTGCTIGGLGCRKKAMINSLLVPDFSGAELQAAQAGILRIRPGARFSTIPMFDGKVIFSNTLRSFVDRHDCSPRSGQASDEIPCNLTLNSRGLKKFVPFLVEGKVMAFQFLYEIRGVELLPGVGLKESKTSYGVAVRFGGDELKNHVELEKN